MKISTKIQDIISSAKDESLEVTKGYSFNQIKTIERINLYINNQYQERNDNAIFWNISNSRIVHFAKNIDLDTKDLTPYGIGEVNFFQAWVLKKKLSKWLEENKFAVTLNELCEGLATYGSIVWKKYKEDGQTKLDECQLNNLYFDQRTKNIKDTDVVEVHYMTESDIREKDGAWNNVAEVLELVKNQKIDKNCIEIKEYWGDYQEEDDKSYKYHCFVFGEGEKEIKLYEEEFDEKKYDKEFPYFDFHIGRYRGRWLRIGVVERLFSLQERANQLVNQNAASTEIASLLLLTTANGDATGNVLEQAINGQIIPDDTLKQLGITNTGLTLFIQELNLIEQHADKICLTPDVMTGEQMPSNTPFRSIAVFSNAAKSAFTIYRQSIGEKVGWILKDEILPAIIRKWNGKEDLIAIAEDDSDVEMYDKALKTKMAIEAMLSGTIVDQQFLDNLDTTIADGIKKVGRNLEVPKDFFNFDYGIKFNVTGESYDKAQQNDAYFNAITMINQNPAILDTPLMRQYLENNGIPYWKLSPKQQQQLQQAAQAGTQPMGQPKQDKLMASVDTNAK
jgi:hypothetical protein